MTRVQKFAEVVAEAINTHVLYIQAERKRACDAIRAQRVITPGCCVVEFVILKNKVYTSAETLQNNTSNYS